MYQLQRPIAQGDEASDSFTLVFRQEERGAVAFAVEAHNVFVVGFS